MSDEKMDQVQSEVSDLISILENALDAAHHAEDCETLEDLKANLDDARVASVYAVSRAKELLRDLKNPA